MNITKYLRVIHNAWRFRFAQVLPSVAHTLMRRYMPDEESLNIQVKNLSFHRWVLALWRQDFPALILIFLGS